MERVPGGGFPAGSAELFLHICLFPQGLHDKVVAAVGAGLAREYAGDLYQVPEFLDLGDLELTLGDLLLVKATWAESEVAGFFDVFLGALATTGLDAPRLRWEMTQAEFQPMFSLDDLLWYLSGSDSSGPNWVFDNFSAELHLLRGVISLAAIRLWYGVSEQLGSGMSLLPGQAAQVLGALMRYRRALPG